MEKEIIILNKAKSCNRLDCDFSLVRYDDLSGEITHTICKATEDEWGGNRKEYEGVPKDNWKPDWCPRKPYPKRRENGEMVGWKLGEPLTEELIEKLIDFGYNECIDEIEMGIADGRETDCS